jgi:hypothetical protein
VYCVADKVWRGAVEVLSSVIDGVSDRGSVACYESKSHVRCFILLALKPFRHYWHPLRGKEWHHDRYKKGETKVQPRVTDQLLEYHMT